MYDDDDDDDVMVMMMMVVCGCCLRLDKEEKWLMKTVTDICDESKSVRWRG